MELLNTYLQAIRFWLPRDQQDIVAELAGDLRSRIEETEASMGRKLSESELEDLLRERGHPLLVAESYLPQRCLIGPVWFPVYWLLLRGFLLGYALPWLLVWLCFAVFVPSYRAEHPGLALLGALRSLWLIVSNGFLALTVGFAVLERCRKKAPLTLEWNPRKVLTGKVHSRIDQDRISRPSSVTSLLWNLFLIMCWLRVIKFPQIPEVQTRLALPIEQYFYWPILVFLLASCAIAAINALKPFWTHARAAACMAIESFGALLAGSLLAYRVTGAGFLEFFSVTANPHALAAFSWWVNLACSGALIFIFISLAVRAIQDFCRLRSRTVFRNWMTDLVGGHPVL